MRGGLPQCVHGYRRLLGMRSAVPATLAAALLACGHKTDKPRANGPEPASNGSATLPTVTSANDATATSGASEADTEAQSFMGVWAASDAQCNSSPWRFTKTELAAVKGPHCSIYKVTKVPGGYDLAAQCPNKKPIATDLIKLRFASSQAMMVESNSIAPRGLVYCGK